nr:mytimycin precursor [Mytilus edulis]AET85056.1 mytimycin precursor [Mytilus edulis]
MSLSLRMTLLFVICCVVIGMANADCCHRPYYYHCWDCTAATPYCGYRPCNIFGCGCTCRTEPHGKSCYERGDRCRCYSDKRRRRSLSFEDMSANIKFAGLDINSDGLIEQFEFIKALEQMDITDNTTMFHHWSIMDEDKDGAITLEEFDKEN